MRIQHNIMSMNAYRNYNTNTSALSRNLEKLSSGYRINRAGDDAAGLAISEKMRAQITGLETAGKNVKDGVSLVKTAEGAMQEVQDMLNRMVELATQSANGTYDNEVDRNNLQQEVDRLKEEIDRIADSANFNGIKLLDGSMTSDGTVSVDIQGVATTTVAATASSTKTANGIAVANAPTAGNNLKVSIALDDGSSINVELELKGGKYVDKATGKEYSVTAGGATQGDLNAALKGAIEDASGGKLTVTLAAADGKMTIGSTEVGAKSPNVTAITAKKGNTDVALGALTTTKGQSQKINIENTEVVALEKTATTDAINKGIFTINGQKFVLAKSNADYDTIKEAVGKDVNVVIGANVGEAAGQIAAATGLDITEDGADGINISVASGKELSLQIGDTSDKFNQMEVGIQDVHVAALGIGGISIANQDDAQAAVKTIKDAINKVSSIRGTLGATQNRLEHTQKNLSVMAENIQDAEATIRDTDVAAEMMSYTKNNILVQSAQAMLAQANQVPQGVLQLLQ